MASSARLLTTSMRLSPLCSRAAERPRFGTRRRRPARAVDLGLRAAQRFQRDTHVLGASLQQRAVALVLLPCTRDQLAQRLPFPAARRARRSRAVSREPLRAPLDSSASSLSTSTAFGVGCASSAAALPSTERLDSRGSTSRAWLRRSGSAHASTASRRLFALVTVAWLSRVTSLALESQQLVGDALVIDLIRCRTRWLP